MSIQRRSTFAACLLACLLASTMSRTPARAEDKTASHRTTVEEATKRYGSPNKLPKDELEVMLKPLTKEELVVEADAWFDLLRRQVERISNQELEVKRKNREISEAKEKAEAAAEKKEEAKAVPNQTAHEANNADREAQQAKAEEDRAKKEAEAKAKEKEAKLDTVVALRDERTKIVDRLNIVLAELKRKGGEIDKYETYITAVSGTKIDVSDASAAWVTIKGWVTSEEGGLRWAKNIGLFLLTLLAFWILGRIVGRFVRRAVRMMRGTSDLLREFLVSMTRRTIVIVGLIVALGQLEVEISPLLAAIGAAGFVVAFALQGTLSNFASGILILVYRPFDVGDYVDVAGVAGTVVSMNLMTTTVKSADNKRVVIPNNSIWGNVITNVTGNATRRIDMVFGIGYADDIDKAKGILEGILASHSQVLKDPEPVVRVHELGDSSVNFVCRPWVNTSDYWAVYWDVTNEVKKRFDAEGVSIPFPQRDIHIYYETPQLPAQA